MRHEARKRGLDVVITCDEELPAVLADFDQVQQVVPNLLTNAFKASAEGGRVEVVLRRASLPVSGHGAAQTAAVELTVVDDGVGMEQDQAARAFEPFFTRWHNGQGTGLGLAAVKSIVDEHGGAIALASRPGRGTSVTVRLPVRPPAVAVAEVA